MEFGLLRDRNANVFTRSSTPAGPDDSKAKKKAQVEAELKEAITALRRPNREMAGKSIVEDAEKRVSTGGISKHSKWLTLQCLMGHD